MITLSIPAPAFNPIWRVNVVRLAPPLVPTQQYCGIVRAREAESFACAVIHPYSTAHLYACAFTALLPLLQTEVWPARQISEITWVDIAYLTPARSRPQLVVRTTRIESAAAEIVWQDRDPSYAKGWESRAWPVIDLLDRIRA